VRAALFVLAPLILGCPAQPDPDDTSAEADADSDADGDSDADADADADADSDVEWISLPGDCGEPDDLPPSAFEQLDELVLSGSAELPQVYFVELVDLEVDAARDVAWGVGQGGIVAFDVSDPEALTMLGAFDRHGSRYYRVELGEAGVVYTTHRDRGLYALDGSDPADIQARSFHEQADLAGMARVGDRLWAVGHDGSLTTFDLSDPQRPEEIHRTGGLGNAWDILPHGDLAYVADNSLGIVVVDLGDPDAPSVLRSVDPGRGILDLALDPAGSTLYAAAGGAGVMVFSLDDPQRPSLIETVQLPGSVLSVAASGERLWAVDQLSLAAFELGDPRAPRLLGTAPTDQWAMHVAAAEDRAYVADWGQLSSWRVDAEVAAPDLAVSTGTLVLDPAGESAIIELRNLGTGALELRGLGVEQGGLLARVDRTEIASGDQGRLRLDFDGGQDLDGKLCIASTDPDQPVQELRLYSGGGSGGSSIGSPAPDFVLTGIDGQRYQLGEELGHPVVLVYFATW
jgi:hypothetical protein